MGDLDLRASDGENCSYFRKNFENSSHGTGINNF